MSFQAPISISDVLSRVDDRRLLLPAIQREFVWESEKIEWLFNSLLQGYPIGSFLFWQVRDADKKDYPYYELIRTYRERYATFVKDAFNTAGHLDFDAVLDGQQRLTSLYIGIKGTYAYKMPRVWWEDTEKVLPTRKLYLNIVRPAVGNDDDEPGRVYEFKFLTKDEFEKDQESWFRVGRILEVKGAYELHQLIASEGLQQNQFAFEALSKLHTVVHIDRVINYYLVASADADRALNVFLRVNSGGEPLSLSDMLMSTAIAHWNVRDARKEIFGLVDQVRARGFFIDKDFILKACLYLYSGDIRYKISNFSASHVNQFERHWDEIQAAILSVFELVRGFGFDDVSLTSNNALLPIVYWVHHKELAGRIGSQIALRDDRETIVLLKQIFGTHADTILAAIRRAFFEGSFGPHYIKATHHKFPAGEIGQVLSQHGKDQQVTNEFIEALLETQYEDKQAFSILALLAPNLDYKNGDFHKDHLHPKDGFKKRQLVAAKIPEADMEFYSDATNWNSILNLRHLDANENRSKQTTPLSDWVCGEAIRTPRFRKGILYQSRVAWRYGSAGILAISGLHRRSAEDLGAALREVL